MIEYLFSESVLKRLYVGPLKPFLNSFEALLLDRGYTRSSIKDKIRLMARFSEWIHQQRFDLTSCFF